ncbi:MAG TPA: histidine kinase dimerization/phospho-acceptor domain-containing protein, partial [Candidatus Cybelea sp.]|nr:histidine kinase dimerization/phospho-acceptor domain-containing protein [Candidatus Cybelea sp.]
MHYTIYLRLIVLTTGTLLPFFWMVVILGHRRQRNFERIFFFLCLSMVCFFGASLLALNAQLYYSTIPPELGRVAWALLCFGLWFLPSLLLHLHVEYAQVRELLRPGAAKRFWLLAAYAPAVLLLPNLYAVLRLRENFNFLLPSNALGRLFQVWLVCALGLSVGWQWRFVQSAPDRQQKSFHRALFYYLSGIAVWIALLHFVPRMGNGAEPFGELATAIIAGFALAPLVTLIRNVQRFNFLQIGRQRNLIYSVFAAFVGLLYFSLIRRVSLWLDPYLPPEATAAILLFLPVVMFEPLQRGVGRILRRAAQREMDHAQRMMAPIQDVARLGDLVKLVAFIEKWIGEQLQLAEVKLVLDSGTKIEVGDKASEEEFTIRQAGRVAGKLRVKAHGAMLSGETAAALEFLCEQLPGALDLCRLIEEKLRLERELAERERLALVGQMAASISHNLKNPLGSMKTILQVQLENPELPESIRGETKMVLDEIGRLSTKLNQLLQFSRPAVRGGSAIGNCDAHVVMEEVTSVLSHEAEQRGVRLQVQATGNTARVAVSAEALNDMISNLVVNALEAAPRGGRVTVCAVPSDDSCVLTVEDDGPGIPVALQ